MKYFITLFLTFTYMNDNIQLILMGISVLSIIAFVILIKLSKIHRDVNRIQSRTDDMYSIINSLRNTINHKQSSTNVSKADILKLGEDLKAEMRKLIARKDDGRLSVIKDPNLNIPSEFFEFNDTIAPNPEPEKHEATDAELDMIDRMLTIQYNGNTYNVSPPKFVDTERRIERDKITRMIKDKIIKRVAR